jgi:hypothetical protein
MTRAKQRPAPKPVKKYNRLDTFGSYEAMKKFDDEMEEYIRDKRARFMDGFADYVVRQGYGAVSPIKVNGKPESWQDCGRRLWGKDHFNEALKRAIERRRGGKTSDPTSPPS